MARTSAEDRQRQDLQLGGEDDHRGLPSTLRSATAAARCSSGSSTWSALRRYDQVTAQVRSTWRHRGEPRERQPVDDLPAHDAGREGGQQQVADRDDEQDDGQRRDDRCAASRRAPGTPSERSIASQSKVSAFACWSRASNRPPTHLQPPVDPHSLADWGARSARLGHLRRLVGDHRPVARRVGDALLEPRVAPLEHLLGERVVGVVVVGEQLAEQRVDAPAGLACRTGRRARPPRRRAPGAPRAASARRRAAAEIANSSAPMSTIRPSTACFFSSLACQRLIA